MTANSAFNRHIVVQFRAGLREQRRELQHVIEEAEKELREFGGSMPDCVDLSSGNSLEQAILARTNETHRKLRMVELALERIEKGSFGVCARCGAAVSLKRLQAVPSASYCVECEEHFEHGRVDGMGDGLLRNSTA